MCLGNDEFDGKGIGIQSYTQLKVKAAFGITDEEMLRRAEARVDPDNVLNLQFTSGTLVGPEHPRGVAGDTDTWNKALLALPKQPC